MDSYEISSSSSLSSSSCPSADKRFWLHVRFKKLPKKGSTLCNQALRIALISALSEYGEIAKIVILHGRGQAIIELIRPDMDACRELVDGYRTLLLENYPSVSVVVAFGKNRDGTRECGWNLQDPEIIAQEVRRSVEVLIRSVITCDSKRRMREKHELKRRQKCLLKFNINDEADCHLNSKVVSSALRAENASRRDICWEFIATGGPGRGWCTCILDIELGGTNVFPLRHDIAKPITELPKRLRIFETKNSFPISREASPNKEKVNMFLLDMSKSNSNKRCLVKKNTSILS